MPRIQTLLRTLWYQRPGQWSARVRHELRGVRPRRYGGSPPGLRFDAPVTPFLGAPGHVHCIDLDSISMLNREVSFAGGIDWETNEAGPLWLYQLHQFDWARSCRLSPEDRLTVIRDWIARHPAGTGWQGGPTSLRLLVWLKLLLSPEALPADETARRQILASIADQVVTLEAHLETHLLANHYLWNLLALVFAGICLEGGPAQGALGHADRLLAELDEQFGADGAHYERSPMYHALLLENVLDLVNAIGAAPDRAPSGLGETLRVKVAAMLGALEVWTHPDGDIALFGDSAHGAAPLPSQLHAYGAALGIAPALPSETGVLRQAGFARLEGGPFVLIASAHVPSPAYTPGHAHCDALSFELSVGGRRVVTDAGVYEYAPGPRRDHARSTAAHATVVIHGQEQAELWASHRIGGRPDVALTRGGPGRRAVAVCAGWATPEILHKRTFEVGERELTLLDQFDRAAPTAELRLPLAPGLEPTLDGRVARLDLAPGSLRIELPQEAEWVIERAAAYPEFGRELSRAVLVGRARDLVSARWRMTPGEA